MPQPRSTTRKPASKPATRSTAKRSATAKPSPTAKRGATTKRSATPKAKSLGVMPRADAEALAQSLLYIGRKQSQDLMSELEALIGGKSVRDAARSAGKRAIKNVENTAQRAQRSPVADRAMREVDRARRVTGIATFPVTGYDRLTINQVTSRLTSLAAPELRKVRDYERRHANRKAVLSAIAKRLSR